MGDTGFEPVPVNVVAGNELRTERPDSAAPGAARGANPTTDPGLRLVVNAWPTLTPDARKRIVGIARAATTRRTNGTR